jgi:hypothetical protein
MQAIKHDITHHYQPTSTSCGYASLSMLLSHFNHNVAVTDLLKDVPQAADENGIPIGSLTAQLAEYCVRQGYEVDFVSFDFLITDLTWSGLRSEQLLEKLRAVEDVRDVHNVGGKHWSKKYVQAYIDLVEAGGKLSVLPHVTTALLYDRLRVAPVYVNICPSVVHGTGRQHHPEPDTDKRLTVADDIHGSIGTHSVVIYGNDAEGNYLVADPWNGFEVIAPESMLCGITAAELECDAQCFQISRKA